jgi:hypothetical protein
LLDVRNRFDGEAVALQLFDYRPQSGLQGTIQLEVPLPAGVLKSGHLHVSITERTTNDFYLNTGLAAPQILKCSVPKASDIVIEASK